MRYLPKSQADREAMLAEIGVASVDDLFASVPEEYRLTRDLDIPRQHAESEVIDYFRARAEENGSDGFASFLGAGAYRHYKPVITDALVQRGEFLTAYTPYQPEISQGTLQAIFEFQTMICELTGMDLANASMYDGSTGAAEAVMMAVRVTGRSHAVVAKTVHPEYREVLTTYAQHQGIPTDVVAYRADGRVDVDALAELVTEQTACVLVQSPNFFGTIEDVAALAEVAHAKGALLIVSIAEAISLGIIRPPKEADIVSLEAQSFGVALSYGGPYCGVIATKEKFIRQMPGRLAGATKDKNGKSGYVLTLSTREQHIRREKATSNICTNQALVALMATIFLTIYGKQGLRELAEHNLAKARFLESELKAAGAEILFGGAPHFHEFVVQSAVPVAELNEELLDHMIIGGLDLGKWYPELKNASLWCATEQNHRADMEAAAQVLKQMATEDADRASRRQTREMAEVY